MSERPKWDLPSFTVRSSLPVDSIAKQDFEAALRKGFWRSVTSWFRRSDNHLLPFEEIRRSLPAGGQHEIGNRQVLLDKIVGSIGRYQDFDRAFLPRRTNTRSRWESIDKAHLQDIYLPPVELYQVGSVYFVRDGNHRVSVARERGQVYIDAYVTQIDVPFDIDEHTNVDEVIRKSEAIRFEEKTLISQIRPNNAIQFSLPGGASKVLEHIDVHRYYMGENRKAEVSYAEAVANWYDEVYWPLAMVIQQNHLLDDFPERTTADLYLWVIEHLFFLKEKYQSEVSLEQAATHFADKFSKKPFAWMVDFIQRVLRGGEDQKGTDG